MPQLSEKPHQGFATKKTALHPASSVPNFRVTLGLRAVVVENGVREIYSARYYNPATDRFMSMDPLGVVARQKTNADTTDPYSGGLIDEINDAKNYNPITARFVSIDPRIHRPYEPNTLHKYLYASGDPVNRIDPSGQDDFEEFNVLVCGGSGDCPAIFTAFRGKVVVIGGLTVAAIIHLIEVAITGVNNSQDTGEGQGDHSYTGGEQTTSGR
jgi:RHS repeat-associated protein